jgi:polar amino acid transport system substrate-binding protein
VAALSDFSGLSLMLDKLAIAAAHTDARIGRRWCMRLFCGKLLPLSISRNGKWRRTMRNRLAAIFVLIGVFGFAQNAFGSECPVFRKDSLISPGQIIFGVPSGSPPTSYYDVDKGVLTGFAVDMASALAEKMCLKTEFVAADFAGLIPALGARKMDALIGAFGITAERQQVMEMVPFFLLGVSIVVSKEKGLHFDGEYDLCGHTVAAVPGQTATTNMESISKEVCPAGKKINIQYYQNTNETVIQVRKGVADAAVLAWIEAIYYVKGLPDLAVGSPILSGDPKKPRNKSGVALRKGNDDLAEAVSRALQGIMDDGTYRKVLEKWDVLGGDIRTAK